MSSHHQASQRNEKLPTDAIFLAIDNGTQSIRALLFDVHGNLLAKQKTELVAYYSKQPGWAEQDANYFWLKLAECCQQLWQQTEVIAKGYQAKIVSVSVTTQRGTVVNVDREGQPLRPAILWLDQRLSTKHQPLPWYLTCLFKLIGQYSAVDYFRRKAQSNWIASEQPEIWQKTHKFLLLSGFLNYRLTGSYTDSIASTVGYFPFNFRKQQWCSKFDWKWRALSIAHHQLAKLVPPGTELGKITKAATEQTGIPENTPVIASASDKACEVLGSGCIDSSTASLSYGTTATINTNNRNYIEPQPFIPSFPSAMPHYFNTEVMVYRGFWMVNWFKQEFGQAEVQQALATDTSPEQLFDELVADIPPGSEGLMLQPYWSPGIKNLEAKGAIIGFGDVHTRAHIYRAILEGLAYALKEGMNNIAKKQRNSITSLMVSGGGSQSDVAMQITADIFNLPVNRPHTYETSGLGAAINAAVALGFYDNYERAVEQMCRIDKTFYPNSNNSVLYEKLFNEVYTPMYQRLKPLYKKIKGITGYPE